MLQKFQEYNLSCNKVVLCYLTSAMYCTVLQPVSETVVICTLIIYDCHKISVDESDQISRNLSSG